MCSSCRGVIPYNLALLEGNPVVHFFAIDYYGYL